MEIANDLIPDNKKDKEWIKRKGLEIHKMSSSDTNTMKQDVECWMMFHNIFNEKEFEYLNRIPSGTNEQSDFYLPAKVRHIPIQRTKLNVLISEQHQRVFQFSSFISDTEGKAEKTVRKLKNIFREFIDQTESQISQYNIALQGISQQREQLIQQLQMQPKTEEEAYQIQMIKMQFPIIDEQLKNAESAISKELLISNKELKRITNFYNYESKDLVEDVIQKLAYKLRNNLDIKRESTKAFTSKIVTGKEAFYVDLLPGEKKPRYECVNTINIEYPLTDGVEWIQDGMWVKWKKGISISQAVDKYRLTKEQKEKLKNELIIGNRNTDFLSLQYTNDVLNNQIYSGNINTEEGIEETLIWFRSPKEIKIKKVPNQYSPGKYFIHFLDNDEKIVNTGQLYWDNKKKKYIHKETAQEYDKKNVISSAKGEELETRYIDEIYEVVILGNDLVITAQKKPIRLYSNENYSYSVLPIIGRTYNSITDRPYSLIWDTKDIQKLYNLINYHRELLLATSGVKGTIMDMSQKPEGMSKAEWMYYKKLGTAWIETVKKSGRVASFNQFGSYDDSVSSSIQYLDNMLVNLDYTLGSMIGVGPQRQGQVTSNDQVATYQMAITQNNLITEIIFNEHDECERRAFEVLMNLSAKYIYKNGGIFDYKTDDYRTEQFEIPANVLNNLDIGINVYNTSIQEKQLKELKQFAIQEYTRGSLPFRDILKLYNTETLKDLEKKFEFFSDEAIKFAQQNYSNQAETDMNNKKEIMQLQAQIDAQLKQSEMQIKQMELQLKKETEQYKLKLEEAKLKLQKEKIDSENKVEMADIETERDIESAYLMETQRSNMVNERLKMIEMQIRKLTENSKIESLKKNMGKKKEYIK
jgi:hypothetical protein